MVDGCWWGPEGRLILRGKCLRIVSNSDLAFLQNTILNFKQTSFNAYFLLCFIKIILNFEILNIALTLGNMHVRLLTWKFSLEILATY